MSDESQIDRQLRDKNRAEESGGARIEIRDPRVSSAINWVWATLGTLAILIGLGVYSKLSEMNDTLIRAVSKIEIQGTQISEMRGELSRQRDEIGALRSQVSMLEGKTLRGIAEVHRGR